jgi:hypothetical protein
MCAFVPQNILRADSIATIAANNEGFKASGFPRMSLDGRMPVLQHPNIICKISQRFCNVCFTDSTISGMNWKLGGIITEPDNLLSLGTWKLAVITHRWTNAPAKRAGVDGSTLDKAGTADTLAGSISPFPASSTLLTEKLTALINSRAVGIKTFSAVPDS